MARPKTCSYCARQLIDPKVDKTGRTSNLSLSRDHIVPRCAGGRKTVVACRQCNNLKGDLMPERWKLVMEHHPKWWRKFHSPAEVKHVAADIHARVRAAAAIRDWQKKCRFRVPAPMLCRGLA